MKWLSNVYDPSQPDAKEQLVVRKDESREEAWEKHKAWLRGKVLGRPKATDGGYSVEELEAMHLVGVYAPE